MNDVRIALDESVVDPAIKRCDNLHVKCSRRKSDLGGSRYALQLVSLNGAPEGRGARAIIHGVGIGYTAGIAGP